MDTSKTYAVSEAIQAQAFRELLAFVSKTEEQAEHFMESHPLSPLQRQALDVILTSPHLAVYVVSVNTRAFADVVLKKAGALVAVNMASEDLPQ